MSNTIFISYRRDDSSAMARSLREHLVQAFGDVVFMDVDEIRVGDTWPATLDNALVGAAALLVVMGPTWLRVADAYGRRRLDFTNDWVRTEIERSLARGIPVIPILVGRATMPPREGLPESLVELLDQQYIELREAHWTKDLAPLVERLSDPSLGFTRVGDRVPVPEWRSGKQPDVIPRTLTSDEINKHLAALPYWKVVTSPLPGEYPKTRTELQRAFRFKSFEQALEFMRLAAPFINERNHHPRWENVFKTVTVYLSTWDTGHVISKLDCDLAAHLDSLFERLKQSKA
jgi:pterin-4a-carbinolamine dehydratase